MDFHKQVFGSNTDTASFVNAPISLLCKTNKNFLRTKVCPQMIVHLARQGPCWWRVESLQVILLPVCPPNYSNIRMLVSSTMTDCQFSRARGVVWRLVVFSVQTLFFVFFCCCRLLLSRQPCSRPAQRWEPERRSSRGERRRWRPQGVRVRGQRGFHRGQQGQQRGQQRQQREQRQRIQRRQGRHSQHRRWGNRQSQRSRVRRRARWHRPPEDRPQRRRRRQRRRERRI